MREDASTAQIIVFSLNDREYALPVDQVVEVIRMVAVSPVPEAPEWMVGLVNVRGTIIPVIDLGARLGLGFREIALNTPIVIASTNSRSVGLIVDEVADVVTLEASAFHPPDVVAGPAHPVSAIARTHGRLVMVLDLERCASSAELSRAIGFDHSDV